MGQDLAIIIVQNLFFIGFETPSHSLENSNVSQNENNGRKS